MQEAGSRGKEPGVRPIEPCEARRHKDSREKAELIMCNEEM